MDILFVVIISGMAVSYITELLSDVVGTMFSPRLIKLFLTLPLSLVSVWFLDLKGFEVAVGGFAAAFFSLAILQLLNRPVSVATLTNRR
jgi:hypothetical protein